MSTSATSDSSLQSRPDKRGPSPSDSPSPKKQARPSLDPTWSNTNTPSPQPQEDQSSALSSPRVHLPSITSLQERHSQDRRASLPAIYPDNSGLRLPQPFHRPSHSTSGIGSYRFPSGADEDKLSRPRLDIGNGVYGSEYGLNSSLSSAPSSYSFPSHSALSSPDYKTPSSALSVTEEQWASGELSDPIRHPDT